MTKVLFTKEVREYLKEVSEIMYEKEYFSFLDSSQQYMESLIQEIVETLPNRQAKLAPAYFARYSENMYYSMFRKSKNTQWYVFFNLFEDDKGEHAYLVSYISNNHVIANLL